MTLRARLLALVVFVAAVPLAVSAWLSLRVHERAFTQQLQEAQRIATRDSARLAQAYLDHLGGTLHLLAGQVEWARLSGDELQGALWLTYHQANEIALVALRDERGATLGAAYEPPDTTPRSEPDHPPLPAARAEALLGEMPIPPPSVDAGQPPFGAAIPSESGAPLLPLVLPVPGGSGRWSLAIAVSLERLCAEVVGGVRRSPGAAPDSPELLLLDAQGRSLCPSPRTPPLAPADAALAHLAGATGRASDGELVDYTRPDGVRMQALTARLPSGWLAVAQLPATVASAPADRIRVRTAWAIALSLLVALGLGTLLGRSVDRPVRRLVAGTTAIARGDFGHRLEERGADELSALARSFNRMTEAVRDRDTEIRGWNAALQQRVEERTQELREAQEQLLRTQQLAAIHALGAGFAHEINNPLTSVIGLTQLLAHRRRTGGPGEDLELLAQIESEGLRIMTIVENLRALAREASGADFVALGFAGVLDHALAPLEDELGARGVRLVRQLAEGLPPLFGDREELTRMVGELLRNAVAAMPDGGEVRVSARALDGRALIIEIADTGRGIEPRLLEQIFDPFFTTKGPGSGQGLGLSLARAIATRHHGQLKITSRPGEGTCVRITLPVAVEGHLD